MIRSRFAAAGVVGLIAIAAALAAVLDGGPWAPATAGAQGGGAFRTWVSGTGDDINPCSRIDPCKTFAGAISKTEPGGEIDVLDPGGYGSVTITHSVSIEAEGELGGINNAVGAGIIVQAGPNDNVVIRGLTIDGLGLGTNGIRFVSGASLTVENTTIKNETQNGIDFEPTDASKLVVLDSNIRNNHGASSAGILVKPQPGGSAKVAVDGVRLTNNTFGLFVAAGAKATATNTVAAGSTNGFISESSGPATRLSLSNGMATDNSNAAVVANGAAATATVAGMTIDNNAVGLLAKNGGQILSYGTNPDADSGAPTGSLPLK